MTDQLQYWNEAHNKRHLRDHSLTETSFADEVNKVIPSKSKIFEVGCGEGNDSIYFAQQGHIVIATDFSDKIIDENRKNLSNPNLEFKVQDISQSLVYQNNSFDVIYARLSLHYFTNKVTHQIFAEIIRMLKPGGYLCFMCKSVDDPLFGLGKQIEPNMFELQGHIRHFFSEGYTHKLLSNSGFQIQKIEKGQDKLYGQQSAFIKVIAKKMLAP